ncbi:PTS transporter subunit EIIC [Actinocorallia longicatena]|uniref:PTS EIIC type-1 domain-containing protein n=1 Tax=Actinocorallia longicatena TaxID=111803 RepID=A0ABP6QM33_9ACTN
MEALLGVLQRLGRSLVTPVAVLPVAVLLVRLGQPDLLDVAVLRAAGEGILGALPLLFALGVAVGFARRADGTTALAAVVGYLVFDGVAEEVGGGPSPAGILGGMVMGLVAAVLYERFHAVELPSWLAFFGGRRFVPFATALAGLVLGIAAGLAAPPLVTALTGRPDPGWPMAGLYGLVNRGLLPFGLHHLPNSVVWFVSGSYEGTEGEIPRYFAGDPHAGGYLAGFFPVLMFGLPGAALAIWHCAEPARRKRVGAMMGAAALASFVTGVSEPIEFAFVFAAPLLYLVHSLLTALSMGLLNALGAQLGFGFSAGLIDLLLNATAPNTRRLPLIVALGVVYFFAYYGVFRLLITRFDLPTPGRAADEEESED